MPNINKEQFNKIFNNIFIKATFQLGVCFAEGLGCQKDEEKAFKYYEKASALQIIKGEILFYQLIYLYFLVKAFVNLGNCYEIGKGCEKNLHKAFENYKKAAELDNEIGLRNLAFCYEKGYGCQKDVKKAFDLYHDAIDKGNVQGKSNK